MKKDWEGAGVLKHYEISGIDFARAGEASSNFKTILKQLGISGEVIRKVAISMYEAEINTDKSKFMFRQKVGAIIEL